MFAANTMWGFMSPVSKFVFLGSAVTPFILADCRMAGAAALFWIASLFTKREKVSRRDMLLLFIASLLGIVFNQGLFTFGLGLTSPVNASIITTSTPILTMLIVDNMATYAAGGTIPAAHRHRKFLERGTS